ncbi:MAG: chromosome segregation protein SMC [Acidobacteria bacterium]|nr:MAG: chromosome segregation protein SMC [Acidobacteriota bacterium]
MLKFESLEIIGFKSFAEKTRVAFDDKVTCVVGPNGCGKSNLSDAIAWVLGAQNARTLRSEKMEDVIFNGTAARKPSGVAEITLTVQRTDEKPIFLDGTELTEDRLEVTRKLYRSGESIYLINQRRCRLKDIHEFLESADLGLASYALIAQGNIESFLSSKPMDRRSIIEEAAGILGYKSRRKSAELKLELAQQNLLRVNDIVAEVERQLRSLKRQAAKARRYRELKEELREVQRRKFAFEARDLKQRLEMGRVEAESLHVQEETLKEKLHQCQETYRARMGNRDRIEKRLTEVRQALSAAHLEVDRSANSIQYHQDQVTSLTKRIGIAAGEQQNLDRALKDVSEELARFREEELRLRGDEQQVDQVIQKHREQVARYTGEVQQSERKLEGLRSDYLKLAAESSSLRNSIEQIQQRRAAAASRRARLEKEHAALTLQLSENQNQRDSLRRITEEKQKQLDTFRATLSEQEQRREELNEQLAMTRAEISELQRQAIACRERLESLHEIELSHSQYSEGVQKFLNHLQQSRALSTSGTLAESIEAEPEYERLVEEVLDEELEYVLVDSLDEAARGVVELKNLKGGKCTFLTLRSTNGFGKELARGEEVAPNKSEGIHGSLVHLLQMAPEVEQAFKRVLPERAGSVVVSDLDRAFQLAHSYPENSFLTLDGEVLTPRGLLSATAVQSKKLGLLALKRQKKELEKKQAHVTKLLLECQKIEERTKNEHEAVTGVCSSVQEQIYKIEKENIALTHQGQQAENEQRRLEQAARVLGEEARQIEEEDAGQIELGGRFEEELREKTSRQSEVERLGLEAQAALQQLRNEAARAQEQFHIVSTDKKVMGERRAALQRTLQRVEEQRLSLEARAKASLQSKAQDQERVTSLNEELKKLESRLEQSQQSENRLKLDLQGIETEYEDWKRGQPEIEQELSGLRDSTAALQEQRTKCEIERARLETQLENTRAQCLEQLQQTPEEVMDGVPAEQGSLEEVLAAYNDLRSRLEEFGPINMTALEEYQENETRFNFLVQQKQDIELSIADTTRAIQEINRRSREKFGEAFQAVNENFKQVFLKLFGGGDCGIQLIGEEDLLESGIDIYAQPPGKKVQNIMLLSGGEKAMTVLALLVALFNYRPSQYCVLDEVDAPLDDANVGRFTGLVKEMSQKTQFIIITHNKRTMETANYIYGVTMEEPGVSQVVSVKF